MYGLHSFQQKRIVLADLTMQKWIKITFILKSHVFGSIKDDHEDWTWTSEVLMSDEFETYKIVVRSVKLVMTSI